MSTNPFSPHTSNLFASRGCDVDAAMMYARQLLDNINPEDRGAATTALMVVINTASNAFAQAQGPGPEKIAVMELIGQIVDDRIRKALDSLDDRMDEWARNSLTFDEVVDDRVEKWMDDNVDFEDAVKEAINDLDLVVRIR